MPESFCKGIPGGWELPIPSSTSPNEKKQHMIRIQDTGHAGPERSRMVQNGTRWFKTVQSGKELCEYLQDGNNINSKDE